MSSKLVEPCRELGLAGIKWRSTGKFLFWSLSSSLYLRFFSFFRTDLLILPVFSR